VTAYSVVLAPQAEDDVREAYFWYRERSASAAESFRTEVFAAIDAIARAPLVRLPDESGNRKRMLKRYPYFIFYDVLDEVVTVLAVAHHRRRPGYWQPE